MFCCPRFLTPCRPRIDADDRAGLEQLARYVTRPPLAAARLQIIDDEHLTFRLKTPWSDGTSFLVLSPLELIEKLAALVPPPRLNLIRYHGVLAPNASERNQIVRSAFFGRAVAAPKRGAQSQWAGRIGAVGHSLSVDIVIQIAQRHHGELIIAQMGDIALELIGIGVDPGVVEIGDAVEGEYRDAPVAGLV